MPNRKIKKPNHKTDQEHKSVEIVQLEQDLTAINPQIFHGLSVDKKEEILRSFSYSLIQERSHSGPLPDAESLIKYNSVIPDGADRIMRMAEKQQNHRFEMERTFVNSQTRQGKRGQIFGLIIGLVGIGSGTFLAANGATTVGGIIAGATVVSLVSVFVIGKRIQKTEE